MLDQTLLAAEESKYFAEQNDGSLMLLEAVHVQRTLWGVIHLAESAGFWSAPVYDIRFLMMMEGSAYLEIGRESVRFSKGDYVLLPYGSKFCLRQSQQSSVICLNSASKLDRSKGPPLLKLGQGKAQSVTLCATIGVDRTRWDPVAKGLPDIVHVKSKDESLPYWTGPLNDFAALTLTGLGPGADTLLCRFADICVIQSLRAFIEQQRSSNSSTMTAVCNDPRVNRILRLINADPGLNWTLLRLADEVGMSRSALAEAFRVNVGQSPMRYLTNIRMNMAAELLRLGYIPPAKVACKVGYGSDMAFSRIFKKHFCVTPHIFQKQHSPRHFRRDQDVAHPLEY